MISPYKYQKVIYYYPVSDHFKVFTETFAPKFMPHMRFVKPLPSNPNTPPIPIRFVFTLDPPMPVSDEICQKLMNVTGLANMDTILASAAIINTTIKSEDDTHTQSLEDMLVMEVGEHALKDNNEWVFVSRLY
jgi:hypothetical protein